MRTLRNLRNNTIYEGKEDLLKVEKMKYYTSPDWKDKNLGTVVIDNDGKSENIECKDIAKNIESFIRTKSSTIILMAGDHTLRVKKSEISKLAVSPYDNISAEMVNLDGTTSKVSLHMLNEGMYWAERKFNYKYGSYIFEKGGESDLTLGKGLAAGLMGCFTAFATNKDMDIVSLMIGITGILAVGAGAGAVQGLGKLKDKLFGKDEDALDNARAAAVAGIKDKEEETGKKDDDNKTELDEDVLSFFYNADGTQKSIDDIKKDVGDIPQDQLDEIKKKVDDFAKDPENEKLIKEKGEWISKLSPDDKKLLDDKAKASIGVMVAQKKKDASDKMIKEMEDELKNLKDKNDPDQEDYMKTLENNLNTKKEEQKKIDEELETSKKTLSEATEKVNSSEAMKSKPSLKKPNIPNSISQNSGDPDPKGGKGENGEPDPEGGKGENGENGDPDPNEDDPKKGENDGKTEEKEATEKDDKGNEIKVKIQNWTGPRGGKWFRTKRGNEEWSEWQNGHYGEK